MKKNNFTTKLILPLLLSMSGGLLNSALAETGAQQTVAMVDEAGGKAVALKLPPAAEEAIAEPEPAGNWRHVKVRKGNTLSQIFSSIGIRHELQAVLGAGSDAKRLASLRPGQEIGFLLQDGQLVEIEFEPDALHRLNIAKVGGKFQASFEPYEVEARTAVANGTIQQSLFRAGTRAGLSSGTIMDMADIFAWDIDFALDIRQGDSFTVVYEEIYRNGKKLKDGEILAAEFISQGKTYSAYRYTTRDGHTDYFAPDGRSMRKQFIRTPVSIARISSRFSLRRKHPVLNRIRAHKGVDYAAPSGTPIKATGNGKVVYRGRKGGYGRTVILQHGSRYTTLYAHMSRYARKVRTGTRVKQGQVIGYIGKSGLATGPHLHYEFRVNGVHRDPLRVKLPKARPLPKAEMASFKRAIAPLSAQLQTHRKAVVALNAHAD